MGVPGFSSIWNCKMVKNQGCFFCVSLMEPVWFPPCNSLLHTVLLTLYCSFCLPQLYIHHSDAEGLFLSTSQLIDISSAFFNS